MPLVTPLTESLGIEVPVIQAGMQWVGYAELASAVSNAGGLGILTALTQQTPEDLRVEIRKCRGLTKKPFGVNITLLPSLNPPDYGAYAKVVIEEKVPIVETAGNNPAKVIQLLKAGGVKIIHKCVAIRHALSAQKLGVDFLSIDGFEAAGHIGDGGVTNVVLMRRAAQALSIPFVASGGFADGQGLAAALALGACGVNMGTRFMCTVESPIHAQIKQSIVGASEGDTELVLKKWKNTNRIFKNGIADETKRIEALPESEFKDVQHLVAGSRGRQVFINGDANAGVWTAGSVVGVIQDIPTCESLLKSIEYDATETLANSNALVKSTNKL